MPALDFKFWLELNPKFRN